MNENFTISAGKVPQLPDWVKSPVLLIDPQYLLSDLEAVRKNFRTPGIWQHWVPETDFHSQLYSDLFQVFVWEAGKNYYQLGKNDEFISMLPCDSGLLVLIPLPLLQSKDYAPHGVVLSFSSLPAFDGKQVLSWEYQLLGT